ncbi:hypothetical protein DCS_05579 [Drechmeria coniospora]|uniref:SCP domain-containing protein n=1 Tax=Drechmeria coniospora TaxID=98403 RepID=A0A151GNJ1_DRECN|nr:hypothetical protein DCS_05579 [Drechmeria coniospora]KYK58562.1 hypothetical protein DCS_05579 [Drechmeria coniospora]
MRLLTGIVALGLLPHRGTPSTLSEDLSYSINALNQARQAKRLASLSWDPNLAAYAQYWANAMATGQQPFAHATGRYRPSQGENLYARASGQCDGAYDTPMLTAMHAWLAQASLYNDEPVRTGHEHWLHWCKPLPLLAGARSTRLPRPSKGTSWPPAGLLLTEPPAQCMWSTTTHVGCARAYSISEPYKVYNVCRFFPAGNMWVAPSHRTGHAVGDDG